MFAISMAAHQTFFAIQYHVSPQDKYQLIVSLFVSVHLIL